MGGVDVCPLFHKFAVAVQACDAEQARAQFVAVVRLCNVIVRAGFQPGDQGFAIIQGGEHENGDFGKLRVLSDAAAHLETIHAGHHHVQ